MADGKWIAGLQPEMAADEAARRTLRARLSVVREFLPRALAQPSDPENVHQLRVGTRRADAALRLFEPCLPEPVFSIARKRLRKLRRAAGEARDWDVFALSLPTRRRHSKVPQRPGLDHLLGYALDERAAAQRHLDRRGRKEMERFDALVAQTITSLRYAPPVPTLLELARATLQPRRNELHRTAAADLSDYSHLHQVRIAGKRLRYAMEVFADCFAPAFRDRLYPRIEEMQEMLGEINDSHVAAGRLSQVRDEIQSLWPGEWERLGPGIDGLLRFHQRRQVHYRKHFLRWLETWRNEGEVEFTELLIGSALAAAPAPSATRCAQ
jgi:CHAD domain-containing protein